MEEDKCTIHKGELITMICKDPKCNGQRICTKCLSQHKKHDTEDIKDFWRGKIYNLNFSELDQEIKMKIEKSGKTAQEGKSTFQLCQNIKKYILDWGKGFEMHVAKRINKEVRSMTKIINNYEKGILSTLIKDENNLEKAIREGNESQILAKELKEHLELKEYTLIESIFSEIEAKEKRIREMLNQLTLPPSPIFPINIVKELEKRTKGQLKIMSDDINKLFINREKEILEKLSEEEYLFKVEEEKEVKKYINREKVKQERKLDQIILASGDKSLIFWDKEYKLSSKHKGDDNYYNRLLELPGGRFAAAKDNIVEIFDTKSRELLFTLPPLHTEYIWCLCNINIESKGKRDNLLITGSADKTLKIWDLKRRTCKCTLTGHKNTVYCILAHSSGYLLTGSVDGTVRVWDINIITSGDMGNKTYSPMAHIHHGQDVEVCDLVELEDGSILSICAGSKTQIGVRMWVLEGGRGRTLRDIPPPPHEKWGFNCGLLIKGGGRVLLGGEGGNLFIFNYKDYVFHNVFPQPLHKGAIWEIKLMGGDQYLTCSWDNNIMIVDIYHKLFKTLQGHTGYVSSILPIFKGE